MKKRSIKFGQCVWEDYPIEIRFNYTLDDYDKREYSCSHIKDGMLKAVIVGTNEGGFDSTGICLECIIDKLREECPELLK